MGQEGRTLCVTGASGFIGSHIVKQALESGYRVRGTVRDASNTEKYGWLTKLAEGVKGKLGLFSADLMKPGSFDSAVDGCEYVCHVASVVDLQPKDPQKEVVDPAVEGTRNVFNSILKAKKAKKVAITSSYYAVIDQQAANGQIFSEADWHQEMSLKNPYPMGKTLAEKHAWKVYEEQQERAKRGEDGGWSFELVALNPSVVLGELLHTSQGNSETPTIVRSLATGEAPAVPRWAWPVVHVKDVALAHLRTLESKQAKGRYILAEDTTATSMLDMAGYIKEKYPNSKAPTATIPDWIMYAMSFIHPKLSHEFVKRNMGKTHYVTSKKAQEDLNISFRAPKEAVLDTLDSYIKLGLLQPLD